MHLVLEVFSLSPFFAIHKLAKFKQIWGGGGRVKRRNILLMM